jgi:hypothetical protein
MRIEAASHATHGRKHGSTFADTWQASDGATIGAIGAVLEGGDAIAVIDLMRTGARAVLTSRNTLGSALAALDRIVRRHAHERRDDDLAAAMLLIALDPHSDELLLAGAGQLHAAIVDGAGAVHPLHGHALALGAGIDGPIDIQRLRLRRDDAIVAATVPMPPGWWDAPHRSAETLVARAGVPEASALLVLPS